MTSRGTSKLSRPIGPTSGPTDNPIRVHPALGSVAGTLFSRLWRRRRRGSGNQGDRASDSHGQARDFLFCGVCGTLLSFDSVRCATCPLCGFKRDAKEIEGKELQYTMTAEDIQRGLKKPTDDIVLQRPVTKKTCPKCEHPDAEFYSMQMRSADEGETTFYTCTACDNMFKEE